MKKRIISFLTAVVMVFTMIPQIPVTAFATGSSGDMQVIADTVAVNGIKTNVVHDTAAKTITVSVDATNYKNAYYPNNVYRKMNYQPNISVYSVGGTGCGLTVDKTLVNADGLTASVVWSYTDASQLYGMYDLKFDYLQLLYEKTSTTYYTDEALNGSYIRIMFPLTSNQQISYSAKVDKVVQQSNGTGKSRSEVADSCSITTNEYNFYDVFLEARADFGTNLTPDAGYDYTYLWTLPDGTTATSKSVNMETYGSGTYKIKITATRKNDTDGNWLNNLGYKESYIAEKTINVNPLSNNPKVAWDPSNTIDAGSTLKVLFTKDTIKAGTLTLYKNGEKIHEWGIDVENSSGRQSREVTNWVNSTYDGGTYTWTFVPESNLFATAEGSLSNLTVNKISSNAAVSITEVIPYGDYTGTVSMKADVPGTFTISSEKDGTTVVAEKTYTFSDEEISISFEDIAAGNPVAGDYTLSYSFVPTNTADYISPVTGSLNYEISNQSKIVLAQPAAVAGTVPGYINAGGNTGEFYSDVGTALSITVSSKDTFSDVAYDSSDITGITVNGEVLNNVEISADKKTATATFTPTEVGKTYTIAAVFDYKKLDLPDYKTFYLNEEITETNLDRIERELVKAIYDASKSALPTLDFDTIDVSIEYYAGTVLGNIQYKTLDFVADELAISFGYHEFGTLGDNTSATNAENIKVTLTVDGTTLTESSVLVYVIKKDVPTIKGVSITVGETTYTSGGDKQYVTVSPDDKFTFTVTGKNFAILSADNLLYYNYSSGKSTQISESFGWTVSGNTATINSDSIAKTTFKNCNNEEIVYSNDGGATCIGTGIYLTYVLPSASVKTEPAAIEGLVYNGDAQALITEGTAENGTMQYTLDGTNYSAAVPTATAAGTYTVYYKVVGNDGYNDTGAKTLTVTIAKADAAVDKEPAAKNGLVYNGTAQALITAGTGKNGTMQYSLDGTNYSEDIPTATAAGTHTVYYKVVGDSNHSDTEAKTLKVTVAKAKQTALQISNIPETVTYGDKFTLSTTGGEGNAEWTITSGSDVAAVYSVTGEVTVISTGSFEVTVTHSGDTNYLEASKSISLNAGKKTVTVTATAPDKVFDGTTNIDKTKIELTFDGILDGDTVGYEIDSAYYSGAGASSDLGVPIGFTVNGEDAFKYKFPEMGDYVAPNYYAEAKAAILPREITLDVVVADKQYDGLNTATITSVTAKNTVEGMPVQIKNGIATFDSVNAASNIKISFTDFAFTGDDYWIASYKLVQPTGVTANITNNWTPTEYTVTAPNANGWLNDEFKVTAADGYTVSLTNTAEGEWKDSLSYSSETAEGSAAFYLKNTQTGAISLEKTESYRTDKTAPTGAVSMTDVSTPWTELVNNITFGLFYNKNVEISVTAKDALSGADTVEYIESLTALTLEDVKAVESWTSANADGKISVTAEDAKQFVYYFRITDKAGNVAYLSTDGAVFDTTAPVISGITDGETYYTTQKFTVTETNIEKVTVNGTETTDYILAGNTDTTYTVAATDRAGNSTTVTVTMKTIASIYDTVKDITAENIDNEAAEKLEETKEKLETLLTDSNITEAEKAEVQTYLDKITALAEEIAATYKITAGADSSWTKGSAVTLGFTANGLSEFFKEVRIDGTVITPDTDYTSMDDTIVTLKAAYLETLSTGTHTIEIVFDVLGKEAAASCNFTVKAAPVSTPTETVHTHSWSALKSDATTHYYECTDCGAKDEVTKHSYTVCGYYSASAVTPTATPEATTEPAETPVEMPTEADTTITEIVVPEEVVEVAKETIETTDGTATVDKSAVEAVVEASGEEDTVVLPLTETTENVVNKAEIDTDALADVAENGKDVVLQFTDATVKLDAEAVKAITEQADGKTVEIRAVEIEVHHLNDHQQKEMEDVDHALIIQMQVFSDGEYISNFDGGRATIMVPFEIEEGTYIEDYSVYFIDDDGVLHDVAHEYVDGHMVFTTVHFSEYVIAHHAKADAPQTVVPEAPQTESNLPIIPIIAVIIVAMLLIFILARKRREEE